MHTLHWNFALLQLCGLWRPVIWSSGWKTNLYYFYTTLITFLIYTFTFLQFVELFGSFTDAEEFAKGSFMLLTMIGECAKIANLLGKRRVIIELTNVLKNDICKPRNMEEIQIQKECDRRARFNTVWYGLLTGVGVIFRTVQSVVVDIPQRTLPFKAWLPRSYDSSEIGFWIAYLHQIVAHAAGASVNIAFDTLIPGLLIQTCAQIKILKHRLVAIPNMIDARRKSYRIEGDRENRLFECELLAECVNHHLEIFRLINSVLSLIVNSAVILLFFNYQNLSNCRFAKTSNDVFGLVVFLQYSVSSVVICVSVYELSKMSLLSTEFATTILYLACMLAQIFNFCFYGGETTLQSVEICDAVYRMDWSSLGISTRKNVVTIMIRSLRPVTFTCVNIITLSLDSFSTLIKLSYSTYNVLQQSGE